MDFLSYKVNIQLEAGSGGNGISVFKKIRGKLYPDGGDGGYGGNIFFQSSEDVENLSYYRNRREFKAEDGGKGERNGKTGKKGKNLILNIPLGTTIETANYSYLFSITEKKIVLKGGNPGKGNIRDKYGKNREGKKGEKGIFRLDYRILADFAIIGYPNVGKSLLLSLLSNAKPKIADYPYTTQKFIKGVDQVNNKLFIDCPAFNDDIEFDTFLVKQLKNVSTIIIIVKDKLEADNIFEKLDKYSDFNINKKKIKIISKNLNKKYKYSFISIKDIVSEIKELKTFILHNV